MIFPHDLLLNCLCDLSYHLPRFLSSIFPTIFPTIFDLPLDLSHDLPFDLPLDLLVDLSHDLPCHLLLFPVLSFDIENATVTKRGPTATEMSLCRLLHKSMRTLRVEGGD